MLKERATARLEDGHEGDGGHSGITHFGRWVNDLSAGVPLEDLEFCCEEMAKLGTPRCGVFNTMKMWIQTSCNGESIHTLQCPSFISSDSAYDRLSTGQTVSCRKLVEF
ncbi:hypothetical protein ACHAWF_002864 [Thalassiosira exigua]